MFFAGFFAVLRLNVDPIDTLQQPPVTLATTRVEIYVCSRKTQIWLEIAWALFPYTIL